MPFNVQFIQEPENIYFEKEIQTNNYYRSKDKVNTSIDKLKWIDSTVGNSKTGENTVEKNIRNSFKGESPVIITFKYSENKHKISLDKLFPEFKFEYKYDFNSDGEYIRWEAIRYLQEGFFVRHIDGQKDASHYATAIILPPINYNLFKMELSSEPAYTGGELIIGDTEIRADESRWSIVIFSIDTPHELKPVLSGERIIFKSEMYYTVDMKYLMNAKIYNQPVESNFKDLIYNIDNKIKCLKRELLELEEERESVITGDLHENKFIKDIKNGHNKEKESYYEKSWTNQFIVLLENRYKIPIPDNFSENDKYTFNLLLKQFPNATIRIMNIGGKIDKGDTDSRNYITFSTETENITAKNEDDSKYKFKNLSIYYNFDTDIIPGDNINSDSVYNDQTYDRIEICDFTILHIQI
jgi:hypothetical protein